MFGAVSVKKNFSLEAVSSTNFKRLLGCEELWSLIVIHSKLLVNKPTMLFVHRNTHTRYSLMNNA